MNGLIVIDKPAGCTSHDVVAAVRKTLRVRKAGHGGTLDPDATGVLLVATGLATRLLPYLAQGDKVYRGTIRLGVATDTYDASGTPLSGAVSPLPGERAVREAMDRMVGPILQLPPPFSAKKTGGLPFYKLARAHRPVPLKPCPVLVRSFELLAYDEPDIEFQAACSAGTYVRALAHDLGLALGCGGHLRRLIRTAVGPHDLGRARSLEALREAVGRGKPEEVLLPMEGLLPELPGVFLDEAGEKRVRHGADAVFPGLPSSAPIMPQGTGDPAAFRLFDGRGRLLALARLDRQSGLLHPFLVLTE